MPMPRLPEIHHSASETKSAVHENMKSAAIAPRWKMTIVMVVDQLILPLRCALTCSALICCVAIGSPCRTCSLPHVLMLGAEVIVAGYARGECKSYVTAGAWRLKVEGNADGRRRRRPICFIRVSVKTRNYFLGKISRGVILTANFSTRKM